MLFFQQLEGTAGGKLDSYAYNSGGFYKTAGEAVLHQKKKEKKIQFFETDIQLLRRAVFLRPIL